MFQNFYGNPAVAEALFAMTRQERIPQTILLSGPEGVGKATLTRRFAGALLGGAEKIEQDDLSLAHNADIIAEREKWPADKRNEDPLLFASHPDFVTFPPDGPLRQIGIEQMRLIKERALFKPLRGNRRVFLIDHIDRANEQAANSLLKTLEEPPEHLILVLTAENPYDLLPTIRSRAVPFHLGRVSMQEMHAFVSARGLTDPERRIALAAGSPGLAISLDLEAYDQRRAAMLTLLRVGAGRAPFSEWVKHAEAIAPRKQEKLELFLAVLYLLLEDLLELAQGADEIRNADIRRELEPLAHNVTFDWMRAAVKKTDELSDLVRRNIQKSLALDAMAVELRQLAR
ncbi:MAG TPA: DNA polymerase III subunit [Bryobacteraceae bacterium]|nr:DNA polymerase III subunit [Bryobacteraceae bacterium]